MSTVTTGLNTAARVQITSSAPTLTLIGASEQLTYQITAVVTDVDGTPLSSQPELYYNIVAGNDVADVSDSGLVTATGAGQAVIQVSAAAFGNTINLFTVDGLPINAIYAEQTVQVVPGVPITPDFSVSLSSNTLDIAGTGTATVTVTQDALNGFDGLTVYNVYYNPNELWAAAHQGQISWSNGQLYITGSGTLPITFTTNGLAAGSYHFSITAWAQRESVTGGDTFGDGTRALTHTATLTLVVS